MKLTVNNTDRAIDGAWEDESLLFTLREHLGLIGSKFGCGVGQCGACTVIIDGEAQRACLQRTGDLAGRKIETIEGLGTPETPHPVQQAWMAESVPQCGYCQAGQMMAAVALLRDTPKPSDQQITDAMQGNLCRCGTYARIRAAIKRVAEDG